MIYLEHSFDAGHRIVGHKGKCARLHGHTYRCEFWMNRQHLVEPGFVVDFGDVKDLVNRWDHQMLLWVKDEIAPAFSGSGYFAHDHGVVVLPFNPTAENMAFDLAHMIVLEFDLDWCRCRLWETPKAYAEATFGVKVPDVG